MRGAGMKLTFKQEKVLNKIGDLQLRLQYEDIDIRDEVSFEFEGMNIVHPMLDETASYEIDPVEYYGRAFLNSEFMDFI